MNDPRPDPGDRLADGNSGYPSSPGTGNLSTPAPDPNAPTPKGSRRHTLLTVVGVAVVGVGVLALAGNVQSLVRGDEEGVVILMVTIWGLAFVAIGLGLVRFARRGGRGHR